VGVPGAPARCASGLVVLRDMEDGHMYVMDDGGAAVAGGDCAETGPVAHGGVTAGGGDGLGAAGATAAMDSTVGAGAQARSAARAVGAAPGSGSGERRGSGRWRCERVARAPLSLCLTKAHLVTKAAWLCVVVARALSLVACRLCTLSRHHQVQSKKHHNLPRLSVSRVPSFSSIVNHNYYRLFHGDAANRPPRWLPLGADADPRAGGGGGGSDPARGPSFVRSPSPKEAGGGGSEVCLWRCAGPLLMTRNSASSIDGP